MRISPCTAALWIAFAVSVADASNGPAVAERPFDAERWVRLLGHESYAVRDEATRLLLRHGGGSVRALVEGTNYEDPEAAHRATRILNRLISGEDAEGIESVIRTLERLGKHEDPAVARRAGQTLAQARQEFLRDLLALGGKVQQQKDGEGRETTQVTLYGWNGGSPVLYLRSLGTIDLVLAGGRVDDRHVRQLYGLTNVRSLDLRYTRIGDEGLERLSRLPNIEALYLSRTDVTDAAMAEVARLKKLTTLYLSDTKVTDSGLERLHQAAGLRLVILRGSFTTDRGIERLKRAQPDVKVVSGS